MKSQSTGVVTPFTRTCFKNDWRPEEAYILVNALRSNRFLRAHLTDSARALNTCLIGFDLASATLLLDNFQGWSEYEIRVLSEKSASLILDVPLSKQTYTGVFRLTCQIDTVESGGGACQVYVKVRDAEVCHEQRIHPRIQFHPQAQPKLCLRPAKRAGVHGELQNISPFGCQLVVFGEDLRKDLHTLGCHVSIPFNDQFILECDTVVKQCRFERKPCCQNRIRLLFRNMNSLQQEQLRTFTYSLKNQSYKINESSQKAS